MGLPYSKQINAAFDQVTPLVAAGFEVLETTKNIAVLLAYIQVLTTLLLAMILAALAALLITMNPDLEKEREALVTPVMKWLTRRVMKRIDFVGQHRRAMSSFLVLIAVLIPVIYIATYGRTWDDTPNAGEVNDTNKNNEKADVEEGKDSTKVQDGKTK